MLWNFPGLLVVAPYLLLAFGQKGRKPFTMEVHKLHDGETSSVDSSKSEVDISAKVANFLGRARQSSSLGDFDDFPTDVASSADGVQLTMEAFNVTELGTSFSFRKGRGRSLRARVKRWRHKEQLDRSEPKGCGFPVCAIVDARPKRFKSMCSLVKWLHEEGHIRRVFEVQKGTCEDAIEKKGHKRPWVSTKPDQCTACQDHAGCSQPVCINDNGHGKSFQDVCKAMQYLSTQKKTIMITIGLGNCKTLYSSCMFTEWWDLDDPNLSGDLEAVIVSHSYAKKIGKQGIHRACSASQIKYPVEFQTLEGQGNVKATEGGGVYQIDKDKVICYNSKNTKKPKPPYYWNSEDVRCRDWKMRYCCHNLWGEVIMHNQIDKASSYSETDVIVDTPHKKTLFDGCEWRSFMSSSPGRSRPDLESRELNYKFMKKSTCKQDRFGALYIDARTRRKDIPWDETRDVITKNTPTYGFYCDPKNNRKKRCKDYKVRFCCIKDTAAQWGRWASWSKCSSTCGGGERTRERSCVKKRRHKQGCFMDGPHGDKRYREQKEACNRQSCPRALQWQDWGAWSACSAPCGKGIRKRQRACFPPKNGGKDCPPARNKLYHQEADCHDKKCPDIQWTTWTPWTQCSVSCGLGSRSKKRQCVDFANGNAPKQKGVDCLGPDRNEEDCDKGHCPVDGGLTEWQNWAECNRACGPDGKRTRQRYCTNPFPMHGGKECKGPFEEEGACEDLRPCPVHCLFSEWGEWTKCSISCSSPGQEGTRQRNRHVALEAKYGGQKCIGPLKDASSCVLCNEKDSDKNCISTCPGECEWTEWTDWKGSCGSCYRSGQKQSVEKSHKKRRRYLVKNGKECKSDKWEDTEEKKCQVGIDTVPCPAKAGHPYWTAWSEWSTCNADCNEKGSEVRQRRCIAKKGERCGGEDDTSKEERECTSTCSPIGWSEWDEWSPCQVTCGKGQNTRKRTCRTEGLEKDTDCKGVQREERSCDTGPCSRLENIKTEGKDATGLVIGNAKIPHEDVAVNHENDNEIDVEDLEEDNEHEIYHEEEEDEDEEQEGDEQEEHEQEEEPIGEPFTEANPDDIEQEPSQNIEESEGEIEEEEVHQTQTKSEKVEEEEVEGAETSGKDYSIQNVKDYTQNLTPGNPREYSASVENSQRLSGIFE